MKEVGGFFIVENFYFCFYVTRVVSYIEQKVEEFLKKEV